MAVLKKKDKEAMAFLKVKITQKTMKGINDIKEQAEEKGLEFPLDEIINTSIDRALKKAQEEIDSF